MEFKEIILRLDELKTEVDNLRPIAEDAMHRYMQKIRLDWNYHSNSIEGNTLTLSETKSLLLYGVTAKGKPMRDHLEVKGHNEALKKLESIVHKDLKITENLIKEFHKLILVEPHDGEAEINPGEYKTLPNYLYSPTGERIDFEPPKEVPRLMNELINWINNHLTPPKRKKSKYELHPLLIACGFHAQFIKIHPFGDGNGRMARILMNLILMQTGYVPSIIKLDDRDKYYTLLNQSTIDDMEPLAEYVGQETIKSLETLLKAAKGESIEEPDDLDKKVDLLKRSLVNVDKIVTKNKQVISKTIQDIYIKFLINVDKELKRFTPLFKKHYWAEIDGKDPLKHIAPQFNKSDVTSVLNGLYRKAKDGNDNNYESFFFLERFNDEDDSFDIVINHSISLKEKHFTINCFVGDPEDSARFNRIINKLSVDNTDSNIEIEISKVNYNKEVSEEDLKLWAKTTANNLYNYIEKEAKKLDSRRANEQE